MKKILLVVVVLLFLVAAAAGIASYQFGAAAEKYYTELLQEAAQPGYATFVTESYSRGVFSSTVRTAVEIRRPGKVGKDAGKAGEPEPLRFSLVSDVRHGPLPPVKLSDGRWEWMPVLAVIETRVAPPADGKGGLAELFQKVPELAQSVNSYVIHLRGEGEGKWTVPAFSRSFPEDLKVRWDGLALNYSLPSSLKGGKAGFSAPLFEVRGKDGSFSVKGMESNGDFREGAGGLSVGTGMFRMARAEFAAGGQAGGKNFFIENFEIDASDKETGETIDCLFQMKVEKAGVGNVPYGPAEFEMELRKLDTASILKLQEIARETAGQPASGSDEIFNALTVARYTSILSTMLKKSPEIEISRFNFTTGEGNFSGKLKVAFDGSAMQSMDNPLLLLAALTAHAEVTVKDRLLEQILTTVYLNDLRAEGAGQGEGALRAEAAEIARKVLKNLLNEKLIVRESDCYRLNADFRQGQLNLNGRTVPLQEFLK